MKLQVQTMMGRAGALTALVAFLLASTPAFSQNENARIAEFERSLSPAISVAGTPPPQWSMQERMAHWKVPGLSVAVIRNGRIAWTKGYGVLQQGASERIDTETLFSVGSVSKVGAAATTLRLVDVGKLNLDRNVNDYLARWKVPLSSLTAVRTVTLRGILSHSAGLSISGFLDFQPGEPIPSVVDTLQGRAPAKHPPVEVIYPPGSRFSYSGGGTTVEQLVIEEASGENFPAAARRYVFEPLGMKRSTYENPIPEKYGNIAKAHDAQGRPAALPRGYETMPEMAASGLWSTPSEYARLVIALIASYQGKPESFLNPRTARQMMTEVGASPAGLGPFLTGMGAERRFFHGGSNDSYRAWMEGHLVTGNGMVIFTNGTGGSQLYPEVRRAVAAVEGWSPGLSYRVTVPALTFDAEELEEKVGVYEIQAPSSLVEFRHRSAAQAIRILRQADTLQVQMDPQGRALPLTAIDATHFAFESNGSLLTLEFARDYQGRISTVIYRGGSDYAIEARRVPM